MTKAKFAAHLFSPLVVLPTATVLTRAGWLTPA